MPTETDTPTFPRQKEPPWDAWPFWSMSKLMWRNGREAGAHAAGLVAASPEKCGRVEVPKDYADGAALSMIAASMSVESYMETTETTVTFTVRCSWLVWETPEPG
jgi:hypothetical protein